MTKSGCTACGYFNWLKGVFFFSSSSGEGGFCSSKICLVFAQGSCKYVFFFSFSFGHYWDNCLGNLCNRFIENSIS